jgi:DNA-binding transcriptional MerR regulator
LSGDTSSIRLLTCLDDAALRRVRGGPPPCENVGQLITQWLAEVTQRIAELRQTQAQLRELARRTAEVDPADCTRYLHRHRLRAAGSAND